MARKLAARKLANIQSTGATICVTGNAGCALHLQARAAAAGQKLTLVHPVELLHQSACGQREHGQDS
jgi:Fe-S oxidoreductase